MAEVEEIKAVQEATGANWKTAVDAVKDAEKILLGAKRGVPTSAVLVERAIQLVREEPHRNPDNVAAIEALKKELKLPIAKVRAAMEANGYDVDATRRQLGGQAVAPSSKALKPSKEYHRRAVRGVLRGDSLLVELRREKILTKAEARHQKELHRNGEYVGAPWDRRIVRMRDGEWTLLPMKSADRFAAVALLADGSYVAVAPHSYATGGRDRPCTEVFVEGREPLVLEAGLGAAITDDGILLYRPGRDQGTGVLRHVGFDGTQRELAMPASKDRLGLVSAAGGRFWLGSRDELLYSDSAGDTWTAVPRTAPTEAWKRSTVGFRSVDMSASGRLAASTDRLWLGALDGLEEASMAGEAGPVRFAGERLAFQWDGVIHLRDESGTNTRIRDTETYRRKRVAPVWFGDGSDLHAIDGESIEKWTGDGWKVWSQLNDAWALVDPIEPLWVPEPRWLPPS